MTAAFHAWDGTMPYAKYFVTSMTSSVIDPACVLKLGGFGNYPKESSSMH